jgi:hypothetical protein
VLELVGPESVARKRADGFFLGMAQRLGIAGALLGGSGDAAIRQASLLPLLAALVCSRYVADRPPRSAGRLAVDAAVSVAAALVTDAGSVSRVVGWLPHWVIVPLAFGQGLALLARRRAPLAALAGTTAIGVFMLTVGYPNGPAIFGAGCAAYALAMHGRRAAGADLARTLRSAGIAAFAALALTAAAAAPGAPGDSGAWGSLILGALVAASWVLGYALRTRRDYVAELRDRAARLEAAEGERAARAVAEERLASPGSCTTSSGTRSASSRSRRRRRTVPHGRTRTRSPAS